MSWIMTHVTSTYKRTVCEYKCVSVCIYSRYIHVLLSQYLSKKKRKEDEEEMMLVVLCVQELQEELSRRREERSSLQEQCKNLEARRRHADRYTQILYET